MELASTDVVFVSAPLTRILDLTTSLAALIAGASVMFMPKFNASDTVNATERAIVIVRAPHFTPS